MSLAVLCWTAVYAVLLSSTDASLLGENGARVLRAESTTDWPSFSILVRPQFKSSPDVNYTMEAKPVGSEGGKMLYDVYARFDKYSVPGLDKSVISYRQTGGYATVIDMSNMTAPSVCLDSESGAYPIPPINALIEGIMKQQSDMPGTRPVDYCAAEYDVVINHKSYAVCESGYNRFIEIIVGDMVINLTRKDDVDVRSNGGPDSGCEQVVKPFVTTSNIKDLVRFNEHS
ncbi:unnamed protein product [Hyaloperonospora brassicae]|uniref:Uncharacterized protein n=1 Tax=Hyaloperonospora brassicae TaxID=162125 RepID=A0AAV0UDK4_HYABA|nr:unnamed protein product [Hyaloperonospora brassicae]